MAYRKAKKKTGAKRSGSKRKMSGVTKTQQKYIYWAAIAVGFFFGDKINAMVDKVTGTLDGKIVAGIEALIGFALPKYVLDNMITRIIGGLLIGAAAKRAGKELGVLSGFRDLSVIQGAGTYNRNAMYGNKELRSVGAPVPGSTAFKNSSLSVISGFAAEPASGSGGGSAMN